MIPFFFHVCRVAYLEKPLGELHYAVALDPRFGFDSDLRLQNAELTPRCEQTRGLVNAELSMLNLGSPSLSWPLGFLRFAGSLPRGEVCVDWSAV